MVPSVSADFWKISWLLQAGWASLRRIEQAMKVSRKSRQNWVNAAETMMGPLGGVRFRKPSAVTMT